jgi:hypothetical protein
VKIGKILSGSSGEEIIWLVLGFCPNEGKDCHYRHALPPGYVLESQMKALPEEDDDKIPIEEAIENQVMIILVFVSFYIVSHLSNYFKIFLFYIQKIQFIF